jgi:hypothetical protein
MATIFLSYRRSDVGGEAGRLADRLKQRLGRRFVFRDVTDIPVAARFDGVLAKELAAARVVLVLIGPTWLRELDRKTGDGDTDYLRVEAATALAQGKKVVPVLLKGAAIPGAEALPADLKALARHQAITLRDESWNDDTERLIDAIGRPYRWGLLALRAAVALLAIVAIVWLAIPSIAPERASDYRFQRMLVLTLLGLYLLADGLVGFRRSRGMTKR